MSAVRRAVVGVVAAVLALTGTGLAAASPGVPQAASAGGQGTWTMMLYVAGDNNLGQNFADNLARVAKTVDDTKGVNIVALVDFAAKDGPYPAQVPLPGAGLFENPQLLQLKNHVWVKLAELGEDTPTGSPATLASFIATGIKRFPAQRYGLVLNDHGGAYGGGYQDETPELTGFTVGDLQRGIAAGLERAGVDKLDLLDHASCLMASYEATSALAPLARTIVGSEEIKIIFRSGAPIDAPDLVTTLQPTLSALAKNPSATALAKVDMDAYAQLITESDPQSLPFVVQTVIATEGMGRLDAAVESFGRAAAQHMDTLAPEVLRARQASLGFVDGLTATREEDPQPSFQLVDLGDFLKHLKNLPPDVEVARNAVLVALKKVVVAQRLGTATKQATGLNVYLPTTPEYTAGYFTDRAAPPGWSSFVEAFLDSPVGRQDGPGVAFLDTKGSVDRQGPDGIVASGQLRPGDEASTTYAYTEIWLTTGGTAFRVLRQPAFLNAGGVGKVQSIWNYATTVLTNGPDGSALDIEYRPQADGLVGTAKASYTAPGGAAQPVLVKVVLDRDGRITGFQLYADSDTAESVQPAPGGTLTPIIYGRRGNGDNQEILGLPVPVTDQLTVTARLQKPGRGFTVYGVAVGQDQNEAYFYVDAKTQ